MVKIRKITQADNQLIAQIIRDILEEMGVPKVGTAYADPELDSMYETYAKNQSVYYVLEEEGFLLGGAGIAPLLGGEKTVCELQKMYFSRQARGRGLGKQMIDRCLVFAKESKFELCYLETLPYIKAAQKLYLKAGFNYISAPLGNTGHTTCNVWLTKSL
jgi:putative acetyltransferase